MRFLLIGLVLGVLGFAFFNYRNRSTAEAELARADLESICRAQKSYLETKNLLKTVPEKDLQLERTRKFQEEVKSALLREALLEVEKAPAGGRRKPLDLAAAKAGAQDWKCPELDQL